MKNLFVWISDVHISIKNLDVALKVLEESLNKARELKIPLFISGDLNDTKAVMRSEWVSALIKLFTDFSDIEIYVLTGNHDMDNKNSTTHSLNFLKLLDHVEIIDKACVSVINGVRFYCIPYCINSQVFEEQLEAAKEFDVKRIIAHQGVLGSFMGDYIVDESSISPEKLKDFEIVLLGHYHKFQKNYNYVYAGSPFTVNFGESDQTKFFHVVNQVNNQISIDHFETKARKHKKYLIDSDESYSLMPKFENDLLQVTIKGTKEFVKKYNSIDLLKEKTLAQSVLISPEIDRQSENRISNDILHSPIKVINQYLEKANATLSKERLKDYLIKSAADVFQNFSSNSNKIFKIQRVTAKNFLSFKVLDFKYTAMGLTLIEGYDEDNNIATGAGKSSFIDVAVYGIFGSTSKDIKADEVINRIAKKNCEVIVELSSDDGTYFIKRYRKHSELDNDLILVLPSGKEVRGKDNRETQKIIEQEIGCSFDLFLKSSYFTQFGSIDRFLSASDTEKKKLISDITDLSVYDSILDKIKVSLKVNYDDLSKSEKDLIQVKSEYETILMCIDQDKVNFENWNKTHQESIQIFSHRKDEWDRSKERQLFDVNNKILQFDIDKQKRLEVEENKKNDFEFQRSNEISYLTLQKDQFESNNLLKIDEIILSIDKIKSQMKFLNIEIENLKKESSLVADTEHQIKELNVKLELISKLEDKKSGLKDKLNFNLMKIQDLNKVATEELHKISKGELSECFNCHQTISSEKIQNHVDCINNEIKEFEISNSWLSQSISQINQSLELKQGLLDKKQELIIYLSKIKQNLSLIFSKESQLKDLLLSEKNYVSQIDSLKVAQNPYLLKIEMCNQKHNPHFNEIEKIKLEVNVYLATRDSIEKTVNPYIEKIEEIKNQENPYQKTLNERVKSMSASQLRVDSSQFNVNCCKLDISYGEWWKTALHVYIKSYLMDSCLEQINQITNEYLNTLFSGILQFNISATTESNSEVKEKISVSIINNGDECSYQSLSGGERCRICLALNLAIAKVILKTSGKNFGVIFFDEILNGLDEAGKVQTMRLLSELEKEYESIFIIDHTTEFKSLFTNSIMIKKKDKISFIV